MIPMNWMTYVLMVIFLFAIQWAVAKVRGEVFNLRDTLILCACACVGLTLYYLILAM